MNPVCTLRDVEESQGTRRKATQAQGELVQRPPHRTARVESQTQTSEETSETDLRTTVALCCTGYYIFLRTVAFIYL